MTNRFAMLGRDGQCSLTSMPALQRDTLADGTSFLGDNGAVAAAANEIRLQVRAVRDISRPEQGPVAGTMDQARPMTFQQGFATARC